MDARDRLLRLIERVYAAPGSVDGWHDFLLDLAGKLDATGAAFLSHDLVSRRGSVLVKAGFAAETERGYADYWGSFDPWAHNAVIPTLTSGTVVFGEELVPHSQMQRTAYYNDFGRAHGIARCIAVMIEVERHAFSCVTLNRTEVRGPFGQDDGALLTALMPHLQRALQIHRRLTDSQEISDATTAALDRLAHGVFLVDASARIVLANRMAEEILRARDGLSVHNRELFGARVEDTSALRRLIAEGVGTSTGEGIAAGGMMMIGRPSGRAALRILVAPVAGRQLLLGPEGTAACIFVTDPDRLPVPSFGHVQHVFGFTAAETRVAIGSSFTVSTTGGSGTGAVTFAASGACSNTDGASVITMTSGTGTCTIVATKSGDDQYNDATSSPASVLATKAAQATLTVIDAPATAALGTSFTVGSAGGSGTGAVSFSASGACTNTDGGALITMAASSGTCSITATKAADDNYEQTTSAAASVTATAPVAPAAPSALFASAVSANQIALAWTDNASSEDGFKIERSQTNRNNFVQVATLSPDVTSYTDAGLNPATKYYYRVRAYVSATSLDSPYSNTAGARRCQRPTRRPASPPPLHRPRRSTSRGRTNRTTSSASRSSDRRTARPSPRSLPLRRM